MSPRVIVLGLFLLVVGASIAIDALIVTDEERLERFVDELNGSIDREYVDRVLGYVDLAQTPLDLEVLLPIESHTGLYDASRAAELEQMFRERMRPYYGDRVRTLQKRIEVEGNRAQVGFTVFGQSLQVRVELKMSRIGERWLVAAARFAR